MARPRPVPRGLVVYQGAKSRDGSPVEPGPVSQTVSSPPCGRGAPGDPHLARSSPRRVERVGEEVDEDLRHLVDVAADRALRPPTSISSAMLAECDRAGGRSARSRELATSTGCAPGAAWPCGAGRRPAARADRPPRSRCRCPPLSSCGSLAVPRSKDRAEVVDRVADLVRDLGGDAFRPAPRARRATLPPAACAAVRARHRHGVGERERRLGWRWSSRRSRSSLVKSAPPRFLTDAQRAEARALEHDGERELVGVDGF